MLAFAPMVAVRTPPQGEPCYGTPAPAANSAPRRRAPAGGQRTTKFTIRPGTVITLTICFPESISAMRGSAAADPRIAEMLSGKQIVKVITVPGRMVNFVVR